VSFLNNNIVSPHLRVTKQLKTLSIC